MEDAHIATIDLGNAPDAAIFGVFDGHGGRCCLNITLCLTAHALCDKAFQMAC